jgi:hypothetical protein
MISMLFGVLIFIRIFLVLLINEEETKKYLENGTDIKISKMEENNVEYDIEKNDLINLEKIINEFVINLQYFFL